MGGAERPVAPVLAGMPGASVFGRRRNVGRMLHLSSRYPSTLEQSPGPLRLSLGPLESGSKPRDSVRIRTPTLMIQPACKTIPNPMSADLTSGCRLFIILIMNNARKIDSFGRVLRSTGFFIVKCKCHTFRVEDSPSLWAVINGLQRCWDCGGFWRSSEVFGRKSEHECGAKCLASKGPSCECSCGGKNHGLGWAA